MTNTYTQENRRLGIKTELGDDALLVTRAVISEQLGRLFTIEVEMSAEDHALDFNSLVGTSATVWLERPDGNKRYFNGLISKFAQPSHEGRLARYKATLVPWLWFLTRTADCRIFQNKTATDIIKEVFKGHGWSSDDYKLDLAGRTGSANTACSTGNRISILSAG